MDGVTDALMREFVSARSPYSYCVSEFIRVNSEAPGTKTFTKDIPELNTACRTQSGTGVQVQILGGNPDALAEAAARIVKLGGYGVDINFGCPAPTVNRHDGGATLLKFPHRIEAIVSSVRSAVPIEQPVSAKLRLGWDDPRAIHINAEAAARGGASWITIHGRTKMQGYTPPAYWDPIGEVRRSLSIPVVANGEIWSLDDLKRCQEATGCIHFMLGRGALAEPGLAALCAAYLHTPIERARMPLLGSSALRWSELLRELVTLSASRGESDARTLSRLKQWLNYACKKGGAHWFSEVKRATTSDQLLSTLHLLSVDPYTTTNSASLVS
jgi:tRNA-dihydrouridine synthase C